MTCEVYDRSCGGWRGAATSPQPPRMATLWPATVTACAAVETDRTTLVDSRATCTAAAAVSDRVQTQARVCVCACTRKSLLHLGLFSLGILPLNARALREKLPSKVQRCIDMSIYYAAILMISIQIENIDCIISKVQLYFDISAARLHQHSHSRARLPSVHPRQVMAGSREKDHESAAWHCFGFQTAARIKHSEIACFVLVKNFRLKMYCILDTVAVM